MGSCCSQPPIQFTRLHYALNGDNMDPDDYFNISIKALDDLHKTPSSYHCRPYSATEAIPYDQLHLLLKPESFYIRNGYARLPDGTMYIAATIDLGEVTGEMFDWWFCNVEDTQHYKWWHPDDHIKCNWDLTYSATPAALRKPGHYIGHTHIVEEKVGGKVMKVNINFTRPSRYFDTKKFASAGITACICARIYINDPPFGYVAVGYFMHIVYRTIEGKSELRSNFWLGDIYKEYEGINCIFAAIVNSLGNTSMVRNIKASSLVARDLHRHCYEEMTCLSKFLRRYYTKNHYIEDDDAETIPVTEAISLPASSSRHGSHTKDLLELRKKALDSTSDQVITVDDDQEYSPTKSIML